MRKSHFIGIDVHCQFCEIAVLNPAGKVVQRDRCDTTIPALVEVLGKVPRPCSVVIEEGPMAESELGLAEMIVDLRRLHTVRLDLLRVLCRGGRRRARVQPLYREHLAKHFADTFSRIGLPEPYPTV